SSGPAKCQPASQIATPTVLVPTSSPASLPCGTAVAKSLASAVITSEPPLTEPSSGVPADHRPEQGIVVDMIIVARQHERPEGGNRAAAQPQSLVAPCAAFAFDQRRRGQAGGWDGGSGICGGRRAPVLAAGQRIDAQHVFALAGLAEEARRFLIGIEHQVRVG